MIRYELKKFYSTEGNNSPKCNFKSKGRRDLSVLLDRWTRVQGSTGVSDSSREVYQDQGRSGRTGWERTSGGSVLVCVCVGRSHTQTLGTLSSSNSLHLLFSPAPLSRRPGSPAPRPFRPGERYSGVGGSVRVTRDPGTLNSETPGLRPLSFSTGRR